MGTGLFIVAPHINLGNFIKERICSHWSKFFPLRVDPFWEDFIFQVNKQEVIKIASLLKQGGKDGGVPIHSDSIRKILSPTSNLFGHVNNHYEVNNHYADPFVEK